MYDLIYRQNKIKMLNGRFIIYYINIGKCAHASTFGGTLVDRGVSYLNKF